MFVFLQNENNSGYYVYFKKLHEIYEYYPKYLINDSLTLQDCKASTLSVELLS